MTRVDLKTAQITRHWWQTLIYSLIIIAPWPFIFFFFVPESFRYFISKGDIDAASRCFKRFPKKKLTTSEATITSSDMHTDDTASDHIGFTASAADISASRALMQRKPLLPSHVRKELEMTDSNFLESVASLVVSVQNIGNGTNIIDYSYFMTHNL